MAAQQILLAFFLCFVPMCDSLNLTAQSFVPGIHELSANVGRRSKLMKQTVENFLKAGTVFGFVMALIASCMPFASRVCTRDPAVIASVASCTPSLAIYCALSGVVCAGEGLLLAQKDLKFLKNSFSIFFFAVPFFLLRLKKSVLDGVQQVGLKSAWGIFAGYQVIRSAMWILRVRQLLIRDET
jgi:Na+-driven multidrug efflux pump